MASMTNTFKYKGFDLNIMFNGMFDRIMQDPPPRTERRLVPGPLRIRLAAT